MLTNLWKPTCPGRSDPHCSTAPTGYLTVATLTLMTEKYCKCISSGYLAYATAPTGNAKNMIQLLKIASNIYTQLTRISNMCFAQWHLIILTSCTMSFWGLTSEVITQRESRYRLVAVSSPTFGLCGIMVDTHWWLKFWVLSVSPPSSTGLWRTWSKKLNQEVVSVLLLENWGSCASCCQMKARYYNCLDFFYVSHVFPKSLNLLACNFT